MQCVDTILNMWAKIDLIWTHMLKGKGIFKCLTELERVWGERMKMRNDWKCETKINFKKYYGKLLYKGPNFQISWDTFCLKMCPCQCFIVSLMSGSWNDDKDFEVIRRVIMSTELVSIVSAIGSDRFESIILVEGKMAQHHYRTKNLWALRCWPSACLRKMETVGMIWIPFLAKVEKNKN